MASGLRKLLGDNLVSKHGPVDVSTLEDCEVIAIQFSAHWCGPCRQFTPHLTKVYHELRGAGKKFEVVFASSDRDQAAFDEYYGEMPWLAISYDDRARKNKLSKMFKVQGIPTVVLLNGKGELITKNGREALMDPSAYPWPQPTLDQALGQSFVKPDGTSVGCDALNGKYLGLYFSAHWCPPCKMFTPKLVEVYNKIKESREDFEVIFVSSDRDEESFKHYHNTMPWLALPFAARESKQTLSQMFEVEGIPTFVMLDKSGKILNSGARAAVMNDPTGADFPWAPKPVNDLDQPEGINESTSLVVLCEGESADEQEKARIALFTVAEALDKERKEDEDADLLFFIGANADGVAKQIRGLTKAGDANEMVETKEVECDGDTCRMVKGSKPNSVMILLDIPDSGGFYVSKDKPTVENIRKFVDDYRGGKLERQQLAM